MSAVGSRNTTFTESVTFKLACDEAMEQCPYNVSHTILQARMVTHLEKCRRSHILASANMGICRFNSKHHIPIPELPFHEKQCADSKAIIHESLVRDDPSPFRDHVPPVTASVDRILKSSDESWDDEVKEGAGYDPRLKLDKKPELMCIPHGMSKSQRRQQLLMKRQIVDQKTGNGFLEPDVSINRIDNSSPSSLDYNSIMLEPLRRPKLESVGSNSTATHYAPGNTNQMTTTGFGMGRGRGRIAANIFGGMNNAPGSGPGNRTTYS